MQPLSHPIGRRLSFNLSIKTILAVIFGLGLGLPIGYFAILSFLQPTSPSAGQNAIENAGVELGKGVRPLTP